MAPDASETRPKSRKVVQGESTRAHLVAVARRLFAGKGYLDTSTEDLVRSAAVTRGALYHHFRDKKDLFEAVFEAVESDMADRVLTAAARGRTPIHQMQRGLAAFLQECLEPEVQQIVLRDGLSVLGWDRWYEIDAKYALGSLIAAIEAALAAGQLRPQPAAPLAHVLLGALNHAGLYLAASEHPEQARREMERTLKRLLDGLTV